VVVTKTDAFNISKWEEASKSSSLKEERMNKRKLILTTLSWAEKHKNWSHSGSSFHHINKDGSGFSHSSSVKKDGSCVDNIYVRWSNAFRA